MKKRVYSMALAIMMVLSVLAFCSRNQETAYADDSALTVNFKYLREDGIYDRDHYNMYVWSDNQGGRYIFFDENGMATITFESMPNEIGFFVKDVEASKISSADGKGGIVKDTGVDRKVAVAGMTEKTLEIVLQAGVEEYQVNAGVELETPGAQEETTQGNSSVEDETAAPIAGIDYEEVTSHDPKADYSAKKSTVVIVDVVLVLALAAGSFLIFSRQKNPIAGLK